MGPLNFSRWRSSEATASQSRRRAQSSCGGGSAPSGAGTRAPRPRGVGRAPLPFPTTGRSRRRPSRTPLPCRCRCRSGCRCRCRYHRRPAGSASQPNAVIRLDAASPGAASCHEPSHSRPRPLPAPLQPRIATTPPSRHVTPQGGGPGYLLQLGLPAPRQPPSSSWVGELSRSPRLRAPRVPPGRP